MSKKITLTSSDQENFDIDEAVAVQSVTLKNMIDEDGSGSVFPVHNVTSAVLAKVIEFCKKHVDATKSEYAEKDKELENWDAEFVKVDQNMLFDLILAANYMNIKELFDLTCKTVADMMRGKTPKEIRKISHIVNDYTEEEEAEVRGENQWAFE